jgi:hypothetical protein
MQGEPRRRAVRAPSLLALLAVSLSLAGCGGPYASEVDGPSGREGESALAPFAPPSPAEVSGTMRLTSLPPDAAMAAGEGPVNCFYVGPDLDGDDLELAPVDSVEVTLDWAPELPGIESSLQVSVYNRPADATMSAGPSPLSVRTAALLLPVAIRVEPNGPVPVAAYQEVSFHVAVAGYFGSLVVWPIGCLE